MKTVKTLKLIILKLGALLLISVALVACGDTQFLAYSGAQQKWPTAPGAMVRQKLSCSGLLWSAAASVYSAWRDSNFKRTNMGLVGCTV